VAVVLDRYYCSHCVAVVGGLNDGHVVVVVVGIEGDEGTMAVVGIEAAVVDIEAAVRDEDHSVDWEEEEAGSWVEEDRNSLDDIPAEEDGQGIAAVAVAVAVAVAEHDEAEEDHDLVPTHSFAVLPVLRDQKHRPVRLRHNAMEADDTQSLPAPLADRDGILLPI